MTPTPPDELTPEATYLRRRELLKTAGLFLGTAGAVGGSLLGLTHRFVAPSSRAPGEGNGAAPAPSGQRGPFDTDEPRTSLDDITHYNNFYELGTDKSDPARHGSTLRSRPWTVAVEGRVEKPATVDLDALLRTVSLEERTYRMRCVEGWSMVIPWWGFPLSSWIRRLNPTSRARYVVFTTLMDPVQLPGEARTLLDWPYMEALRLDEALHPLTFMAVGLYGHPLPAQNGAPLRLVVPWKYGFKGIKSVVKVRFQEEQPLTTWQRAAPSEYGFFANVNPAVDHPRWSQATERRVGEFFRRKTLPFNGYADQVASLYAGMDLGKNF